MSIPSISLDQLRQAVQIKEQIASLEAQLAGIFGGPVETPTPDAPTILPRRRGRPPGKAKAEGVAVMDLPSEGTPPSKRRRGGMSAEGRARIAAAQKARWAKVHAAKGGTAKADDEVSEARKRRKMSLEGRANVAPGAKARWAKNRKQKWKWIAGNFPRLKTAIHEAPHTQAASGET